MTAAPTTELPPEETAMSRWSSNPARKPSPLTRAVEPLEDRCLPAVGYAGVAGSVAASLESAWRLADACYRRDLGRPGDAGSLGALAGLLQRGFTEQQVDAWLVSSPEYVNAHGGLGPSWVSGLYQQFLGRQPDPFGLSFYSGLLANGFDPVAVATAITGSTEREAHMVAATYARFLGRGPGEGELNAWAYVLTFGFDSRTLGSALAGSAEFRGHFGGDADWLAATYADTLGRTPTPGETQAWVGAAPASSFSLTVGGLDQYAAVDNGPGRLTDLYLVGADGSLSVKSGGAGWVALDTGVRWAGFARTLGGGVVLADLKGSQYRQRDIFGFWTVQADFVQSAQLLPDGTPVLQFDAVGQVVQQLLGQGVSLGSVVSGEHLTPDGAATICQFQYGAVLVSPSGSYSSYGSAYSSLQSVLGPLGDSALADQALADVLPDGGVSRSDLIGLFRLAERHWVIDSSLLSDLRRLVDFGPTLGTPAWVTDLADDVVYHNPANAAFQGWALGDLVSGSGPGRLEDLVQKWFLGADHPSSYNPNSGQWYSYTWASGSLFRWDGTVGYSDVRQGYLGDCTYMAAFAEVAARYPWLVQRIFHDNGDGTFTVCLFKNGSQAHYVTVDRSLPTYGNGNLVYEDGGRWASDSTNVLWPALLEKAFAQANEFGGVNTLSSNWNAYAALDGGNQWTAISALAAVAGAGQAIWYGGVDAGSIAQAYRNGWLVVLGTDNPNNSLYVPHHEYAMVGYDPTSTMPFYVYNPWGFGASAAHPGLLQANGPAVEDNFVAWGIAGSAHSPDLGALTVGESVTGDVTEEGTESGGRTPGREDRPEVPASEVLPPHPVPCPPSPALCRPSAVPPDPWGPDGLIGARCELVAVTLAV
jgi:hypothetical protein